MERLSNHPWQVTWIGFRNSHFGGASKLLLPFCVGLVLKLSFFVFFRWVNQVRFRSISHFFGQVGHTHNVVDQRLSVAVTSFQNEKVIETPQEWVCINIYIYIFLGGSPQTSKHFLTESIPEIKYLRWDLARLCWFWIWPAHSPVPIWTAGFPSNSGGQGQTEQRPCAEVRNHGWHPGLQILLWTIPAFMVWAGPQCQRWWAGCEPLMAFHCPGRALPINPSIRNHNIAHCLSIRFTISIFQILYNQSVLISKHPNTTASWVGLLPQWNWPLPCWPGSAFSRPGERWAMDSWWVARGVWCQTNRHKIIGWLIAFKNPMGFQILCRGILFWRLAGGIQVRQAGQRLHHVDQAVGFEHMLEPATVGGSPIWLPSSIAETIGGYATIGLVWQGQEGVSCHIIFFNVLVMLCSCLDMP